LQYCFVITLMTNYLSPSNRCKNKATFSIILSGIRNLYSYIKIHISFKGQFSFLTTDTRRVLWLHRSTFPENSSQLFAVFSLKTAVMVTLTLAWFLLTLLERVTTWNQQSRKMKIPHSRLNVHSHKHTKSFEMDKNWYYSLL
jgi:hypothetical protein